MSGYLAIYEENGLNSGLKAAVSHRQKGVTHFTNSFCNKLVIMNYFDITIFFDMLRRSLKKDAIAIAN